MRIGYFEDDGHIPVTKETRRAVQRAAQALRDDGFAWNRSSRGPRKAAHCGTSYSLTVWPAFAQGYKGRESDMYSIVSEVLDYAAKDPPLTTDLLETLFGRDIVRSSFLDQMERYPILFCPVSAVRRSVMANARGPLEGKRPSSISMFPVFPVVQSSRKSRGGRSDGTSGRASIGVQIVGRPWEEEQVLAVAARVERAGGWKEPPILKESECMLGREHDCRADK